MKKVRYEYEQYEKKVDAMQGNICIATLKIEPNEYEAHEEMSDKENDEHYDEMIKVAKKYEGFISDSRLDDEYNHRQF